MSSSPQKTPLSLVGEEPDPSDVDSDLSELRHQIADSEARLSSLESELGVVAEQEMEATRQLETRRTRRIALDRQLAVELEEAARLKLAEAAAARHAILVDSERKAANITEQALEKAADILAEAERERDAIVKADEERLRTLEEDAAQRAVELDAKHQTLSNELQVMQTLYDELQSTLKLVAETSIKELAEAQSSLDPADQEEPPQVAEPGDSLSRRVLDGEFSLGASPEDD